jgi:hypothetical protein
MSINAVLARRQTEMTGRLITEQEAQDLKKELQPSLLPSWLLDLFLTYPLVETTFRLTANQDSSGLGVAMKWLSPRQIISETTESFPGISAAPLGYVAIGMCLEGSGDPYFLKSTSGSDPLLVRIPHDAVDGEQRLRENLVEIVSTSLSEFLDKARIR